MAFKPMKTRHKSGAFRGQELRGQGMRGPGLGDYVGQPGTYDVRPTVDELIGMPATKEVKGGPSTPNVRPSELNGHFIKDRREIPLFRNIPVPSRQFVITPRIVGLVSVPLDVGIANRADVAIWNVSVSTIWIGTSSSIRANMGCPLGPSAAGAYNGAAVSADLSEEVKFWGIASAAGDNLVVIMESAK